MPDKPPVSIVIPNWNGAEYLPPCLESLRAQTYMRFEVIVADNASTDGSQELLRDAYPEVRLVQLPENRGFTGAANAGIEAAQGEVIVLLNNDTEVEPGWLGEVTAAFERHPEAGSVASKMLLYDRRDTFHTVGDTYSVGGLPGNRGVWEQDESQYDVEEYVFSACGGSAAYRRAMLEEVGPLDEDFFFSCEDVDLGWRAQLAGWRCVYVPGAVVYHHLAATGGDVTASYYNGRNYLWLIAKDYPGPLLRKHWPVIVRTQARIAWEALKAWRGRAARARLCGMLGGLLTLPGALRKRRRVQRTRSVSIEYIESILTPEQR
jgi:GT2 family glycosyltransferase